MADREKVIKGLEHCIESNSCYGCPYDIDSSKCIFQFHADVLALMKEQQERIETLESLRRIEQKGR